jgi:hypothetical protein
MHFNETPFLGQLAGLRPGLSFFEGIDGPEGLSGAEPESGKTPIEARFRRILTQKNLGKN